MYIYENKTIVIIGAGLLQIPAIKIAKELGLKTIVTDYNEAAPGMKLADIPIVISTRDIDGTVREMRRINEDISIDGVITVGTDASRTVAAVANALNLPGIKFEDAIAATNKVKMRERFDEFNVPIPAFRKCWSLEDLKNIVAELGLPLVIKPTENMGARGVMKISDLSMLDVCFRNAKEGSPTGELIVEEYMDGPELSIDALVYKGDIKITGVADRIIEREPYFIELGHVMPSALPQEQLDDAVNVFIKGIKALGITNGAAKGDIKVTKKGAKVGEIAARLSGGFMSGYTYPYHSGVNLIKNAIDISLGYPPATLVPTRNFVAIEKAIIPPAGVIKEFAGIKEAMQVSGLMNIFIHKEIGDIVYEPKSNVEKTGNFIVVKETREEAWETVKQVESMIKVIVDPLNPLSWADISNKAKNSFDGKCFVCTVCNGIKCRGLIPGFGGIGNGNSFVRNCADLSNIKIITSTIHKVKTPDTSCRIGGIDLALPVIAAPMTGCDINMGNNISELEYASIIIEGCRQSGIIGLAGDGAQPNLFLAGIQAIRNNNGHGGAIFKPRESQKDIITRIKAANDAGAKITGIDIDGAAFITMALMGQPVNTKSIEELIEIKNATNSFFIIKGIMSVRDAFAAIDTGADAIVVSNHGGRISESHPSSISVLPEIVKAVNGRTRILFDGGIRTGEDIYKAIALGADAVLIGRPFATAALGGGVDGVKILVERYKKEFSTIMKLTGCSKISDIRTDYLIS